MKRIAIFFIILFCLCSCDNVFTEADSTPEHTAATQPATGDDPGPGTGPGGTTPVQEPRGQYLMTKKTCYWYSSDEVGYIVDDETRYTYDTQGRMQNRAIYSSDILVVSADYSYDSRGNLQSIIETDLVDPVCSSTTVRAYDAENRIIRDSYYEYDMTLQRYSLWHYDAMPVVKERYDEDDVLIGTEKYYYNDTGLLTKMERYHGPALASYTLYSYHDNGRTRELAIHAVDGTITYREDYTYNESWQLTGTVIYGLSGSIQTILSYQYDEHGNSIRKESFGYEGDPHPYIVTYAYEYVIIDQ